MTETKKKPIHPDIPTDTAWQIGRRIYVHTSGKSQLGASLFDQGAHWDKTTSPWSIWVGSTKKDSVVPEILDHMQRVKEMKEKKADLKPISFAYRREDLRAIAKEAGGMWDRVNKRWLVPAPTYDQIKAILAAEVAESVYIPYAADTVTARARELGATWDRTRREWRMSTEAAVEVRDCLLAWRADQAKAEREQQERDQLAAVAESGRARVDGSEPMYWYDNMADVGDIRYVGDRVYVIDDVIEDFDDEDDYMPGHIRGVEVEPNADDLAAIAHRTEIEEIARGRRAAADEISRLGEYPEGHQRIDADHLMSTQNAYGGGDWFCVTADHVWYVKNNGGDGDSWGSNNVLTGGAGAIGRRLSRGTAEGEAMAQSIRALTARRAAAAQDEQ